MLERQIGAANFRTYKHFLLHSDPRFSALVIDRLSQNSRNDRLRCFPAQNGLPLLLHS